MRDLINNLINLSPQTVIPEVYFALAALYLALLLLTLTSVINLKRGGWVSKSFWTAVVVFIPVAGIVLHCLRCVWIADKPLLARLRTGP